MDLQDRLALEYLSRELVTNETRLYEHVAITFRWLMATLFAANGGAIIALMGDGEDLPGSLNALAWFAGGTVLSLVMGILSTYMAHRATGPVANARAKVNQGLITGETAEAKRAVNDLLGKQKMTWWQWSPTYAGLAAFVCFVAGIVTIAGSIIL